MPTVKSKKKAASSASRKASPKKKAAAKKAPATKKKAATNKKTRTSRPQKKAAPKRKAAKTTPRSAKTAPARVATKSSGKANATTPLTEPTSASPIVSTAPITTHLEQDGPIIPSKPAYSKAFFEKQRQRLLSLRDELVDTMASVARGNLREHAEGNEASAFGMHQADAGSDAYDRDLALNLLSQEQNALYEIEEALIRIENGTYGYCEVSGAKIMKERLEAMPFARLTVECQSQREKEDRMRGRASSGPIFKRTQGY